MAMSEEAFDAAMGAAGGAYGGSDTAIGDSGFSSTVEEKEAALFGKTLEKQKDIYGATSPQVIQSIQDGDGYTPVGGTERRMTGFDAYEVNHEADKELMAEEGFQNHLARQRQQIAQDRGIPVDQVSNEDVYELGNRDKLNNLYEMVKQPGDAPWTPGPTTSDELQLGSAENPLNIPIGERKEGIGTHGRQLASAFNPNNMQNVNEQMYTDSNALYFKDKKSKNGKFVPDTKAMELQNAATFLKDKKEAGITPTPEEIAAFGLKNDQSRGGNSARANAIMDSTEPGRNADGRTWSNVKGVGAGVANIVQNAMDTGSEGVAWAGEKAGLWDEEYKKAIGEVHDSTLEGWQKTLGVNTQYADKANSELSENVANGNYIDAAISVVKNLDVHLAQSAPEMGALALKVPGLIAGVNSRVKEVSEEFEKTRGREPTAAEEAGMWATSAAVLVPEKFLMVGPLKSIFKSAKAGAKSGSKAKGFMGKMNQASDKLDELIPKGKSLGGSAKVIGVTAAGEVVQEVADQAQETYWKEGRMITKEEAISAGIAGGVMGGTLKGAGETKGLPANAKETVRKHQLNKNVSNMSKEDIALRNEDAKEMIKEGNQNIANSEKAEKEVAEAETFESLENSDNKDIQGEARRIVGEIAGDKDFYNRDDIQAEMKENIAGLNETRRKRVTKKLELKEDATDAEILAASVKAREKIPPSVLQRKVKKEIIDAELNGKLDTIKKDMSDAFVNQAVLQKKKNETTQGQVDELNTVRKTQGKKGNVSGRKTGKIDTSKESLNEQSGGSKSEQAVSLAKEVIKKLTGFGSTTNSRIQTELNKYDNESIRNAMDESKNNAQIQKVGQKILDKREKADAYKKEDADISDLSFTRDKKTSKADNFQKLKRLVSQREISNQDEKDYIDNAINEMETRGDISKKQATIMRNRLAKNKVGSGEGIKGIKDKKLFRDSNDVKADIATLEKVRAKLKREGGKSGANDGKIQTIDEQIAGRNAELDYELQYEKENGITPAETVEEAPVETEKEDTTEETVESEEEIVEEYEATEEDAEPKKNNEPGTTFTEAELNNSDPVSEGYEVGDPMTKEEIEKLITC